MVLSVGCRSPRSVPVPPNKERDRNGGASPVASYAWIGSTLAATLLLCIGGGYWLDESRGTAPIFFLIGAFVGLIAVFAQLWQLYKMMTGPKQ